MKLRVAAALALALSVSATAAPQNRHPISGRVIAPTMSVAGAPWLDRPERESEEQPTRAVRRRVEKDKLSNVTLVQGAIADPNLPAGTFDMILMVDVYHELAQPQAFTARLKEALKDDGRLVLIEYRGEDSAIPIHPLHKMTVDQVRQELGADGFAVDRVIDVLPWQHIIVLKKAN